MGDINVLVTKQVDLFKQVNKNIDKIANIDVINNDVLAEAEGDAEAFGPNAVAQVDVFTFANSTGTAVPPTTVLGAVDSLGNSTLFESVDTGGANVEITEGVDVFGAEDIGGAPIGDGLPDVIIQKFNPPSVYTAPADGRPTLNGQTGFGNLIDLTIPPPPLGTSIPNDRFTASDKHLQQVGTEDLDPSTEGVQKEYVLSEPFTVNYGVIAGAGAAILTVPAGSRYLVEFESQVSGDEPTSADPISFLFDDTVEDLSFEIGGVPKTVVFYAQDGQTLNETEFNISDWAIELEVEMEVPGTGMMQTEAFAYGEALAAIDLDFTGGIG